LTLEDETDRLSRNVGKELPILAALIAQKNVGKELSLHAALIPQKSVVLTYFTAEV